MPDWIGEVSWWDTVLLSKCRQHVQVEHYDDATLCAFKCVEERIRDLANIGASEKDGYGTRLVNQAFNEKQSQTNFALRLQRKDVRLDYARFFISGAFGLFRNDPAHQFVTYDRETCIAVLRVANLILQLVEKGRATTDDLWYEVRNPGAVVAPDAAARELLDIATRELLNETSAVLRNLLLLRGQSAEYEEQLVTDLIDHAMQDYLLMLHRRREKRHVLSALKESLLQMLDDEDSYVRKSAILYLRFFRDDSIRTRLCELLRQEGGLPEELMVNLIDTLAVLNSPDGRKAIVDLLVQAPTPAVKSVAIEALGQMEYADDSIKTLLDLFDELAWPDKQRAIEVFDSLKAREAVPKLEECLHDDSWSVQIAACETLEKFAEPRSARPLGELLLTGTSSDVRRAAAYALSKIKSNTSVSYLEKAQVAEKEKEEPMQDKDLLRVIGGGLRSLLMPEEEA